METKIYTDEYAEQLFKLFDEHLRWFLKELAPGFDVDRIGFSRGQSFVDDVEELQIKIHMRRPGDIARKIPWDSERGPELVRKEW